MSYHCAETLTFRCHHHRLNQPVSSVPLPISSHSVFYSCSCVRTAISRDKMSHLPCPPVHGYVLLSLMLHSAVTFASRVLHSLLIHHQFHCDTLAKNSINQHAAQQRNHLSPPTFCNMWHIYSLHIGLICTSKSVFTPAAVSMTLVVLAQHTGKEGIHGSRETTNHLGKKIEHRRACQVSFSCIHSQLPFICPPPRSLHLPLPPCRVELHPLPQKKSCVFGHCTY